MKKILKELIPAIILALVASFMLFIYEPIITYAANMDDFWFDLNLMMPNIILYFFGLCLILIAIYSFIYFISCKLKKEIIYKITLIISFVLLIFFYIQGVYLIGNLPTLDGTTIEWGNYTKDTIISISSFVIITIAEIILVKKFNIDKALNINKYIAIAIFIMISISTVSSFANPSIFDEKIVATATNRNINNASSNKNFFIFLVDAVDSYDFNKVLEESDEYSDTFEDFTYYPDTVSAYTFTNESIPFIFSGIWYENETELNKYCNKAFNNSELIKNLKDKNYDINFYENEIRWSNREVSCFQNVDIYNDKIDSLNLFKQLTKFILYKYLPYPLKQYSHIETADFSSCKINEEDDYYKWNNNIAYENIKNNKIEKTDKNYFQFLHIEGGHVPFDYDENVNIIPVEEGTYKKKLKATLKIIDSFIKRLKEYDAYDNSAIIVMADHGYWNGNNGRQNPILFVKGVDEHHEMNTSEIPVSYEDLNDLYKELLDNKKTDQIFNNIDKNRIRRFIDSDGMIEYEQRGKAWEKSGMIKTGREFK